MKWSPAMVRKSWSHSGSQRQKRLQTGSRILRMDSTYKLFIKPICSLFHGEILWNGQTSTPSVSPIGAFPAFIYSQAARAAGNQF
ncbi:hypothetical protein LDENG_00280100 [Lucifuga dentata]|nr:hypothetical protein LDENG_00280100 [Lucifuga dentata]